MTKQASSPPTSDKGAPTAPPPPPAWRHYLWLVAAVIFLALFIVLPTTTSPNQVTLNYSQFLHDVSAHEVKNVTIATTGSASGTLKDGKDYTTVIPPQAGEAFFGRPSERRSPNHSRDERHVLRRRSSHLADPAPSLRDLRLPVVAPFPWRRPHAGSVWSRSIQSKGV